MKMPLVRMKGTIKDNVLLQIHNGPCGRGRYLCKVALSKLLAKQRGILSPFAVA